MGQTNRGKYLEFAWIERSVSLPTNFYLALVTAVNPPTVDTNTLGQLTQIAVGNGYTDGGYQLARNDTDFDSLVQNDTDNRAELKIKDIVWTASGGPIPASGDPAAYVVRTTDEATVANRQVTHSWSLGSGRSALNGQTFTLIDLEMRKEEPA